MLISPWCIAIWPGAPQAASLRIFFKADKIILFQFDECMNFLCGRFITLFQSV